MSLLKVESPTNDYLCMLYMFLSNLSANVKINRETADSVYNPLNFISTFELTSVDAVLVHRNNNKENSIFYNLV